MPRSTPPDVEFPAPIGVRVRVVTLLVFAILGLLAVLPLLVPRMPRSLFDDWASFAAPALGLPIVVPVMLLARVKGYRLAGHELHVVRLGRITRVALAGLRSVEADPQAMHRAWKTWGNDGLGAITGRFRSRRLGRFDALLTDPAHAVVLRWAERTLVVSPGRPAFFVSCVRERANLPA